MLPLALSLLALAGAGALLIRDQLSWKREIQWFRYAIDDCRRATDELRGLMQ